jgi:anthranilate synthase component 1
MKDALITLDQFRKYAQSFNVIPVARKLLSENETPLSLYIKLTNHRASTFLLESAEAGIWARYSFIGVNSQATLSEANGLAIWNGVMPAGAPVGIDPLSALKIATTHLCSPKLHDLPPLTGGLVGYLGYEVVRRLEKLPTYSKKDLELPEISMMLTSDLAVFDHQQQEITLIANAINWDGSNERIDETFFSAIDRLDKMESDLNLEENIAFSIIPERVDPIFIRNTTDDQYTSKINLIKEEIKSGEAFQVVLSQRFSMPITTDPFNLYRVLRDQNPSPYMYLFRFENGLSIVGSSPEALTH